MLDNGGTGFSFDKYAQYTRAGQELWYRFCFAYSDSASSGAPNVGVRLRNINGVSNGQVFWVDYLGSTWSGSGLVS